MLTGLMVFLRSIALICGGHRVVVLENLALRQQLAVLTRTVNVRTCVRRTDCFGSSLQGFQRRPVVHNSAVRKDFAGLSLRSSLSGPGVHWFRVSSM